MRIVAQLDLLMALRTAELGTRPIDLIRDLSMDRSTLNRNLHRLQARGLVTTNPGANQRESRVSVAPAGQHHSYRRRPQGQIAFGEVSLSYRPRLAMPGCPGMSLACPAGRGPWRSRFGRATTRWQHALTAIRA